MKQQILDKIAELLILVNGIVESDSSAIIAALQAEVADLTAQLAAKDAELVVANTKLSEIDLLAKEIDAKTADV